MRLTVFLIFLIPNIAFSKNIYDTIPKSNINFNKLFGYELDYSFQYDGEGFFSGYQN